MKKRSIFYIIILTIMGVLSYIFIYDGLFLKNKLYINYKIGNNVNYKVNLLEDELYNGDSTNDSKIFIANKVNDIDFNINYDIEYDREITGYYSYGGTIRVITYDKDNKEMLFERDYKLDRKTNILNESNDKDINIEILSKIDYKKYRDEIIKFVSSNKIEVYSYILLDYDIDLVLNFNGLENTMEDSKNLEIKIPLSLDTFKIDVINNEDNENNYYDYSNKEDVNYLLLGLGIGCLIIFILLLILVIRDIILIYKKEYIYRRELRYILNKYKNIIINTKRLIRYKDYNLIYVDNFKELMDVYNKYKNPISYKEIKKNKEAIFILRENDNAWVYILNS